MSKSRKRLLICSVVCLFLAVAGLTQDVFAGGAPGGFGMQPDPRVERRTYTIADTNEVMPYSLFVSSKVKKEEKAPLVVLLHGLGVDNSFMMRGKVLDLAEEGGYIVVAPLGYTTGGWYGIESMATSMNRRGPQGRGFSFGSSVGGKETDPVKVAKLSEKDVMNVFEIVLKEFNIDERRMYLTGHSMGGAGTLHLGVKYAEKWAALGPIAPAAFTMQPTMLEKIKDMPIIVVQGDKDTLVPVANTRKWVEKMKELKMPYEYKEQVGGDHGSVITDGIAPVFKFFSKQTKPEMKAKK